MINRLLLAVSISMMCICPASAVDNDRLAFELFKEGRYAQAAELFTDPAWKGTALYRSDQWWRAAEAFIRANDADSYFNLGNCYVKLSYYALALEAYQQALAQKPDHADAAFNREVMLKLLAADDEDDESRGLLKPKLEELDRVNSDGDAESGEAATGDEKVDSNDNAAGDPGESEEANKDAPTGKSGQSGNAGKGEDTPKGEQGMANMRGENNTEQVSNRPSGGSENEGESDNQQAAGMRSQLENNQATEQWLNNIKHDPYRFLEKRIDLELKRRADAGQRAPDGGSVW